MVGGTFARVRKEARIGEFAIQDYGRRNIVVGDRIAHFPQQEGESSTTGIGKE
jgi:hypothetical protein